jgi:signal peptidase I
MRTPQSFTRALAMRLRSIVRFATFVALLLTARASFADHYRVPSGSMEPTVHVGDHILVAKIAYGVRVPLTEAWVVRFAEPRRGDVIVLDPPPGDERATDPDGAVVGAVLLKRVVAVEGEIVSVHDGRVEIDGRVLAEPWASLREGTGPDLEPVRVPRGKVLVLGDNRGNSRDGRAFGWIDRDRVLGRAVVAIGEGGVRAL